MALRPPSLRRGPVRVVLARTTLLSLTTSWRAAALALVELGGIALFASGVAERVLGESGAWFVLMAVGVSLALRAVDLESCALFVRRGLRGEVEQTLGPKAAATAVAVQLADHLLLGTLAAVVVGHYVALPLLSVLGEGPLRRQAAGDLSTAVAVALVGFLWWWQRQGRSFSVRIVTTAVSIAVAPLALTIVWALASSVAGGHLSRFALPSSPIGLLSTVLASRHVPGAIWQPVAFLTALGYCLCVLGSGEALAHVAPELRQPRIRQLQWTARPVGLYALLVTAGVGFLVVAIVPAEVRAAWLDAPVAALALNVRAPLALRLFLLLSVVVAAVLLLAATLHRAAVSAQGLLSRLSEDGVLAPALRTLHT